MAGGRNAIATLECRLKRDLVVVGLMSERGSRVGIETHNRSEYNQPQSAEHWKYFPPSKSAEFAGKMTEL